MLFNEVMHEKTEGGTGDESNSRNAITGKLLSLLVNFKFSFTLFTETVSPVAT